MIDKVNFSNYNDDLNSLKDVRSKISFKGTDDSFEKVSDDETEELKEYVLYHLKKKNFTNLVNGLVKDDYWTNCSDFVEFDKTDDKISGVTIGLKYDIEDGEDADKEFIELDLKTFKAVLTDLAAYNIVNNPDKENDYKKMFINILKYMDKNKVKDS